MIDKIGLCSSCKYLKTCIFSKDPPIWQCEEFFSDNNVAKTLRLAKVNRVIREEVTESE